jgi:CspA family cold shock protein
LYTVHAQHAWIERPRISVRKRAVKSLKIADIVEQDRLRKECAMPKGTIKRLVRDRGFGFIRDDGGQEWFFHRSGVQGSFDQLAEGQRVSFDEESSPKGPRAGNVRSES